MRRIVRSGLDRRGGDPQMLPYLLRLVVAAAGGAVSLTAASAQRIIAQRITVVQSRHGAAPVEQQPPHVQTSGVNRAAGI
jgi:hypothetical protein